MKTWNIDDAINLIVKIEELAPKYGCHVALTGGVLYKVGASSIHLIKYNQIEI